MFCITLSEYTKPLALLCSERVAYAEMPPKNSAPHFEEGLSNLNGKEHESE